MIQTREEFEELCRSERPEDNERLRVELVSFDAAMAIRQAGVEVRKCLVMNKAIDADVLREFVRDPDSGVRSCVARRRLADAEILGVLAQDADATVRAAVAWNPKTPISVRDTLLRDEEEIVRRAAHDAKQKQQR
ncbi:MAG TPA: hypothetical protein VFF65_03920 [Phycisphaerales bacterium]|nr:hypothetical protein [Phycisphaerales bacterium]